MPLKHVRVLLLVIFCFALVATSSPSIRSAMQATHEKLTRISEKKRTPNEDERNERRSAYVPNDNDEENGERDLELDGEGGSERERERVQA